MITFLLLVQDKINKKVECSLMVACSENIILCMVRLKLLVVSGLCHVVVIGEKTTVSFYEWRSGEVFKVVLLHGDVIMC